MKPDYILWEQKCNSLHLSNIKYDKYDDSRKIFTKLNWPATEASAMIRHYDTTKVCRKPNDLQKASIDIRFYTEQRMDIRELTYSLDRIQ